MKWYRMQMVDGKPCAVPDQGGGFVERCEVVELERQLAEVTAQRNTLTVELARVAAQRDTAIAALDHILAVIVKAKRA